jgi:hypothetical protein
MSDMNSQIENEIASVLVHEKAREEARALFDGAEASSYSIESPGQYSFTKSGVFELNGHGRPNKHTLMGEWLSNLVAISSEQIETPELTEIAFALGQLIEKNSNG